MLLRTGSLCCLCLYVSIAAWGADSGAIAPYQPTADRLIDAALADNEALARLAYLCDHIGNRLSGSDSLTRAVAWGAEQMKQAGLQNVTTIPVKVPHWVRGSESAALLAPVSRPLHMLGLGMSVGTPAQGITADAIVVSTFDELTRRAEKVAGKIVVFNAPYEGYGRSVAYRATGPSRAAKLGAAAVLVRSITPLALQLPHTGALRYSDDSPKIPAAAITAEDAAMLSRLQASGLTPRIHLEMGAHMEPDADSADVVGEIPGSEHPEQVVVMGGHIDSWDVGQGAQDDGSGIMATLGAAALIHRLGLKPRRTIRVVFWVNEENGGLVHVKRNLTLLRLGGRRRCQSDYDRFDVAMPQSLEIRKDGQHCQTNSDRQHQHSSGFRNAGRSRFFTRPFWQIHTPVSERTSRWQARRCTLVDV